MTTNKKEYKEDKKEKNTADFLSDIYDDFCLKLADGYPSDRFDKEEAFPLWVEKVKNTDNPQEMSNKIGHCIWDYIKKFSDEEKKYIPKLSNVLGKYYTQIVEAQTDIEAVFECFRNGEKAPEPDWLQKDYLGENEKTAKDGRR